MTDEGESGPTGGLPFSSARRWRLRSRYWRVRGSRDTVSARAVRLPSSSIRCFEFSLVVFRHGLVDCSDYIVVLESDAQYSVPIATFAIGVVLGVFDRGNNRSLRCVLRRVTRARIRGLCGERLPGLLAAEDVDLGPVSHPVSYVILTVVVIEVERVVVIVVLFGIVARLVFKLCLRYGIVVLVIFVVDIDSDVVEADPEEFFGC